jgi:hypothetical protein
MGWVIPLCRWPFPRLCGFPFIGQHRPRLGDLANPLFGFHLPPEYNARASYPSRRSMTAPLLGFPALQHIQGSKVHFTRALPARYSPPPGFDYPRGGFLPSSPGRFCFAPAALLGFTLRSFLLAKRCPLRFHRDGPTYRLSFRIYHPTEAGWPAPESRGFWVSTLPASPSRTQV